VKVWGRVLADEVRDGGQVDDVGAIDALSYMLGFEGSVGGVDCRLLCSYCLTAMCFRRGARTIRVQD